MTCKEATREIVNRYCGNCDNICLEGDNLCAIDMALVALNKQIHQQPKQDKRKGLECYCPVCGDYVGWMDVLSGEMMNYCGNCGQAIDWRNRHEREKTVRVY